MDIRKTIVVSVGIFLFASVCAPAVAKEFCYFWVEKDGTITAYDKPPFNVSGPPFGGIASEQGRLIIAQTEGPCLGSSLKKPNKRIRSNSQTQTLPGSLSSIGRY